MVKGDLQGIEKPGFAKVTWFFWEHLKKTMSNNT